MGRISRSLSIHAAVIAALTSFVVLILVLIALNTMANRSTDESMETLNLISRDQLNELNRGDSLLNQAMLEAESAVSYLDEGMTAEGNEAVAEAVDRLERAQARFDNFEAAPRTPQGAELIRPLNESYQQVMPLIQQQVASLRSGDLDDFMRLRRELQAPVDRLASAITEFNTYAFSRVDTIHENMQAEQAVYQTIFIVAGVIGLIIALVIYLGLRRTVIAPLNDAVRRLNKIADADLTEPLPAAGRNEVGRLFAAMGTMQENLTKLVSRVRDGSSEIHHGTREIASGNADLSSRTEQQASSIQETAASMEQMTATVKQNADNARQASTLAADASTTAEQGGNVVGEVVKTMHGISTSSQKVADITSVIDSIAFQTNILALNASVEAARAGEQGRGFAVVAGEVRNLASRSADAAKEIKELIEASVSQIKHGSTLVEQAGTTMTEVVDSVRRVTDIMDEISAASQEQSDGIEQVSQAVGQMDEVTQQNASLVQQATSAAASLEEQANRLEQAVAVFKIMGMQQSAALPSQSTSGHQPAAARRQPPARPSAPAPAAPAKRATPPASHQDEWEEF